VSVAQRRIIEVNQEACHRLARLIGSRQIPIDREDIELPKVPRDVLGNFFFLLVAICHQTSPRHRAPLEGYVEGEKKRGWDYLLARLQQKAHVDRNLLTPSRWTRITAQHVRELFHDSRLGERLSSPELRAHLIQDLGKTMQRHGWDNVDQICTLCGGRVASGDPNLLDVLARFHAYRDPVRKKSLFFLALMRNSGQWEYHDDHNLGSPVDYHEVRGHLRIGTVSVTDAGLRRRLANCEPVQETDDVAIRRAVYDAIMLISELSGLKNPSQLHYLFWNVFRSMCTREEPQCLSVREGCSLRDRYAPLTVQDDGTRRCPFADVCASTDAPTRYYEHVFETDYY
jgi:hypothetical protein